MKDESRGVVSRRDFFGGALAAGVIGGCRSADLTGSDEAGVRFLAFADIHYYKPDGFWPHGDREWLDRILQRAVDERCDFVMSLGDMTFGPKTPEECDYVRYYNDFKPVRTYHTYGNHEYEDVPAEVTDRVYGLKRPWYSFDLKGFRFIVLDPHYLCKDGRYLRFDRRCSYPEEKVDRILPPEQMAWLRKALLDSPYPCVIFSHESIERPVGGISNRKEVLTLIAEANRAVPGKVRLAVNGHEHKDFLRVRNGVVYFDLNSASYDIGADHTAYPASYVKEHEAMKCCLTWDDPLSAVITLTPSGGMSIRGSESRFHLGVTPEMAGWKADACGRETAARIQSAEFHFHYS